jgi:hypothetical protein
MHSVNHPKIEVLQDVAKGLAISFDLEVKEANYLPPDTLATGQSFPIYPPIADRYGVRNGSYRFKSSTYASLDLEEFVRGSFAEYGKQDPAELRTDSPEFNRAAQLFSEIA